MKMMAFAQRNAREMLRDPLTMFFGAGFPLALLLLLNLMQRNIPAELFAAPKLAPGVIVFGYTFLALFSALLISKDRSSALMMRLLTAPLRARDFILGYALPVVPLAVAQSALCMLCAFALGMKCSLNVLLCMAVQLPCALIFIALGLMLGSLLNDKQVGSVCGALLTNVCAWLSGTWFDLELLGGGFAKFARCLPFAHAVDAGRAALAGDMAALALPLAVECAYAAVLCALAVAVFAKRMRRT